MTSPETAAIVAAGCVAVVTAFQAALAVGAPWGRAAYGGQHPGTLPSHLRTSSAVSVIVWPTLVLVLLRRAGHDVPSVIPDGALEVTAWIVVGLLGLSVLMNGASRSRVERTLWTPICVVAFAASLVVAL